MAAFSPVTLNKIGTDVAASPVSSNGTPTPQRPINIDPPKQNLRGLNKPKCIKCGNVARSRCPFQSCKGCCAKAQNPCHIHVLKQSSTLPDKPPPSASPLPEQPPIDTSSKGASSRLSSLRQLSSTIASSLRAKKPLSRKDAANLNKWRFAKLREYIDGNIEAENEAFDRYIENVSLLEETFFANKTLDGVTLDGVASLEPSSKDEQQEVVSAIKAKLQFSDGRAKNKERIKSIVDKGLAKLQKWELDDDEGLCCDDINMRDIKRKKKILEWRTERTAAFSDLFDKLVKARNDDDLKSCLEIKQTLDSQKENESGKASSIHTGENQKTQQEQVLSPAPAFLSYSLPKLCTAVPIKEETSSDIEARLSSANQIIHL